MDKQPSIRATRPFSVRLTDDERSRLERDAAGLPLGTYIRARLLGEEAPRRRAPARLPVKDHQALGRLLGELGRSNIANNLNQLARAAHTGTLPVTPETEDDIRQACRTVSTTRALLIKALGLGDGGSG